MSTRISLYEARRGRWAGFGAEQALTVCQDALDRVVELVRQSQRAGLANVDVSELAKALELDK